MVCCEEGDRVPVRWLRVVVADPLAIVGGCPAGRCGTAVRTLVALCTVGYEYTMNIPIDDIHGRTHGHTHGRTAPAYRGGPPRRETSGLLAACLYTPVREGIVLHFPFPSLRS